MKTCLHCNALIFQRRGHQGQYMALCPQCQEATEERVRRASRDLTPRSVKARRARWRDRALVAAQVLALLGLFGCGIGGTLLILGVIR